MCKLFYVDLNSGVLLGDECFAENALNHPELKNLSIVELTEKQCFHYMLGFNHGIIVHNKTSTDLISDLKKEYSPLLVYDFGVEVKSSQLESRVR